METIFGCSLSTGVTKQGRLLCGYGTGVTTVAVPMHVSKVSSADVRVMLGSYFQVKFSKKKKTFKTQF